LRDSTLESGTGSGELTDAVQALAHPVQVFAKALMIDQPADVALLVLRDSALEPRTGGGKLAGEA
jgi:hypothetical protein